MHSSVIRSAMLASLLPARLPSRSGTQFWIQLTRTLVDPLGDQRMDELSDVAAEPGDLANHRRGDEHEFLVRHQEQRLDFPVQAAIHSGHLEFVLEIGL